VVTIDISRLEPLPAGFPDCGVCPYRETGAPPICLACASKRMTPVPEEGCEICRHPTKKGEKCRNPICNWEDRYFDRNYSIALRTGPLQMAIGRYKYDDRKAWAVVFARLLVAYLDEHKDTFSPYDLIVASPTYVSAKGDGRRWDHTRLVLQEAARIPTCRWPFDQENPPAIEKSSYTTPMASKAKWKERRSIAEDDLFPSLRIPDRKTTRGKRILVYDDVFTDGLTLRQVARCLKEEGGATRVSTITLARQVYRGNPTPVPTN